MNAPPVSIAYLDGQRLARALSAGIIHLFQRRDYINRINVFPVPDGDTGTNLAFTFQSILEALKRHPSSNLGTVADTVSRASLDGARGNSGAIMAQYFQGFQEVCAGRSLLTAETFARASQRGSEQAWTAMAEPVAGTLPTVLEDFSTALADSVAEGERDLRRQLKVALKRAQQSLRNTPNLLPVLKQAGVVDAGGQGFVDLLEGVWAYTDKGQVDEVSESMGDLAAVEFDIDLEVGDHRFCTECVISGKDLDRAQVMRRLLELESSSLVVAGGTDRLRVHIHTDNPSEVFLACEAFGEIAQQKADDMQRQHGLLNQKGEVAIVVDSGADLPGSEVERLGIHIVPVRLSFGDREFLDGVSLDPETFYSMLDESDEIPQTSQPPPRDFKRVYTLLTSHGYKVMSVGLSTELSGTTQAARTAATGVEGEIRIFDTRNASSGQGLLALVAAEAAASGLQIDEVEALLTELAPQTVTLAIPDDLSSAVRGGRVPAWLKKASELTRLAPVLIAKKGRLGIGGVSIARGFNAQVLARHMLKRMKTDEVYRVLLAHVDNREGATAVRKILLENHSRIHSCHIAPAGPALGVHLGRGGVIAGFLPQPQVLTE
ncbi:MAG: DegV family EDD domain-containing protein [Xanthomonadales bacterium]|nr:DegV family EDD domain-containing protein [Xanthomonadales bacterium]NNL94396.1 DegV family EDD domain-containing protein [Xanthomonadales bacterium]